MLFTLKDFITTLHNLINHRGENQIKFIFSIEQWSNIDFAVVSNLVCCEYLQSLVLKFARFEGLGTI